MGFDIRKKEKNEKAEEFVREMKERHEEARAALIRLQEEMKRQADRSRKEAEEYRVGNKVLISTKDFSMELRKRATKKLTEKFIGLYVVKKIVSENAVELELLVKIVDSGLYFIFFFHFILFLFFIFLLVSIFRTTRVRVDQSHCHISHKTDHRT